MSSTLIEFLSKLFPFQNLSKKDLEEVVTCIDHKSLQIGECLFQIGEPYQKAIYIIQQGKVEQRRKSGQILTLGQGDFVGLANFLDASPYYSTVKALTFVKLLCLPATGFQDLEIHCPPLFNGFNRLIAKYIRDQGTMRPATSHALCLPARTIMNSPLTTCGPDITLRKAYEMMCSRKIGSLGVTDKEDKFLGLINFACLADAMLIQAAKPDTPVLKVTGKKNHTVHPDTPLWQIEEIQQDHGLKYVIVVEDDKPIGIISQTDILNNLIACQGILFAEIASTTNFTELKAQGQRIGIMANEARENNHRATAAVRSISEFHLALQRRCIKLTLQEMEAEGLGSAPTAYAFILMGSGSRKEMMINPDQDNAIIIADDPVLETDTAKQWFQTFCYRVNQHLGEIGYELCSGNIMAKNVMFHKTLNQWKQQISHISYLPTQKAARWANIFLDFYTLYGDDKLAASLSKHVHQELTEHPRLLKMMVTDDAEGQAAVGWFNRLITLRDQSGKGKIDIKRNGLRIIADAARIYALKHGIESRNTADRLAALVRQGVLSIDFMTSVSASFEELLDLLLEHQLRQLHNNQKIDKLIVPETLSPLHHESLRMAMRTIKQFQEKLQVDFDTVTF
jgi:CBS domain-containing protein